LTRLKLWPSPSSAAWDDVHEHNQGDDNHRGDRNDGNRGRAEDHAPLLFLRLACENLGGSGPAPSTPVERRLRGHSEHWPRREGSLLTAGLDPGGP
jgi:hypothetical protein